MAKYKAYPEYKDSEIEWLGKIPSGWLLKKAKYIFQRVQRPLRDIDGVVTAFRDGQVTLRTNRRTDGFTNSVKEIGYQGVRRNDLVIHAMDGFAGAIGVSDSDGKCSPVCSVCIPWESQSVNMHFYGYLVRQLAVTDFILSLAKGIRERSTEFRFSEFSGLMLAIPPIYEQNQIATFLDYETAKIDNLIEKQQQLIELLKEKRQAVISHAVTKGLNPDVPMKDSGVEWLGEVPAHWVVMHMRHAIVRIEQGKSPECEARNAEENEWGVLKSGCVNGGLFNEKEHKALPHSIIPNIEYEVHPGDLIMSRASGSVDLIGSMAFVYNCRTKLLLSDKTFRVIPIKKIAPEFLSHLMGSLPMRNQIKLAINGAEGLANNITKESIKSFYMVAPCFSEQVEIASFITAKNKIFDQLETKLNNSIKFLQERRTALISAAVTGKIDVRDWVAPDTQDVEEPQEATA